MARILMIEDDARLAAMVGEYLAPHALEVTVAPTAAAGLDRLAQGGFAAVVLDVMLPDLDGFEVCRRIRATSELPVLMLTARGDDTDRIVGLELGADDYLPKPFNPKELLARVKAVLRRKTPSGPPGAPAAGGVFQFGDFSLNLATRTLTRGGKEVALTTGEFSVLKVLVQHPRQPLSRDKLMELARGREYEVFDRSIDVQISRLRKIVEDDPAKPKHIQTVWGFGYVFVPDIEAK
jgi:two-component system phosphate regulon response regulator OmpR